jgi:hypothetical protein
MTRASSILIFIFVAMDFLIYKESRNTEMSKGKNNDASTGIPGTFSGQGGPRRRQMGT